MSNGAAGCGAEYTELKYRCSFLSKSGTDWVCLKYKETLEVASNSGEPFRTKDCSTDAWKSILKHPYSTKPLEK